MKILTPIFLLLVLSLSALTVNAAQLDLNEALDTGKIYLSSSYGISINEINYIKTDAGGVQATEEADRWKIWYSIPKNGEDTTVVVFVKDDKSAFEGNKQLAYSISEESAKELLIQYLISNNLILDKDNTKIIYVAYGELPEGYNPNDITKSWESVTPQQARIPTYNFRFYIKSQGPDGSIKYSTFWSEVDGITGYVIPPKPAGECLFRNIISEEAAINAVKEKTGNVLTEADLGVGCSWFVSSPEIDKIYYVYDDGTMDESSKYFYSQEDNANNNIIIFGIVAILFVIILIFLFLKWRRSH